MFLRRTSIVSPGSTLPKPSQGRMATPSGGSRNANDCGSADWLVMLTCEPQKGERG